MPVNVGTLGLVHRPGGQRHSQLADWAVAATRPPVQAPSGHTQEHWLPELVSITFLPGQAGQPHWQLLPEPICTVLPGQTGQAQAHVLSLVRTVLPGQAGHEQAHVVESCTVLGAVQEVGQAQVHCVWSMTSKFGFVQSGHMQPQVLAAAGSAILGLGQPLLAGQLQAHVVGFWTLGESQADGQRQPQVGSLGLSTSGAAHELAGQRHLHWPLST